MVNKFQLVPRIEPRTNAWTLGNFLFKWVIILNETEPGLENKSGCQFDKLRVAEIRISEIQLIASSPILLKLSYLSVIMRSKFKEKNFLKI